MRPTPKGASAKASQKTAKAVPETKKPSGAPRHYGSSPVQYIPPTRTPGRKPTRRVTPGRRRGSPPAVLIVAVSVVVLVVLGGLLMVMSDDEGGHRERLRDAEPISRSADAPAATTTPAATAAPTDEPPPSRPAADDGLRDSDGEDEETAEEAKERLEAIKRVRAAENAWVEDAQGEDGHEPARVVEED